MNENSFSGRVPRLIELAATLGPLRPVRVTYRERLRLLIQLWRTR